MALEIERRLLLKRLPTISGGYDEIHKIQQFYGPSGRFRFVEIFNGNWHSTNKGLPTIKYIHTVKKSVSKGVNQEVEIEISKNKFEKALNKCTKSLNKTRYIKKVGKYKWEIDVFDFKMVIAEVEVKTKGELKTVKIPKFIKKEMICDVTGNKQFSNFTLSEKWKKKK